MLASCLTRTRAFAVVVGILAAAETIIAQSQEQRARDAVAAGTRLLAEWYGPAPEGGEIAVRTRWLAPARGRTIERDALTAVSRRFWPAPANQPNSAWFAESLSVFSRARAMDHLYSDDRAYERRFFGAFIPYVVRSVVVSHDSPDTDRAALALRTLERHIGWAALQPALAEFAPVWRRGVAQPGDFAGIVNRMSGRDLTWFFHQAFDPAVTFDFGIERLTTEAIGDGSFQTVVVVARYGDGSFSGRAKRPEGPFRGAGALDVSVSFADGSEVQERWDGRDREIRFTYLSRSPAVSAVVDPDRVVWLDVNRANNARTVDVATKAAAVWAMRWLAWLEDLMLTYSVFV